MVNDYKTTDVFHVFLLSFHPSLTNCAYALSVTHAEIANILEEGDQINTQQLLQLYVNIYISVSSPCLNIFINSSITHRGLTMSVFNVPLFTYSMLF